MGTVLWITLIGMGLVFLAVLLLWGLMALLVHWTAGPALGDRQVLSQNTGTTTTDGALAPADSATAGTAAIAGTAATAGTAVTAAAAAAVAVALALALRRPQDQPSAGPAEPASVASSSNMKDGVSPWQSVHRARWLFGNRLPRT
jgi:hypothetical protein